MTGVFQNASVARILSVFALTVDKASLQTEIDLALRKGRVLRIVACVQVRNPDNGWALRCHLPGALKLGECISQVPGKIFWPKRQVLVLVFKDARRARRGSNLRPLLTLVHPVLAKIGL